MCGVGWWGRQESLAAGGGHSSGPLESRGGSRPGPRTHQWDASRLCCGGAVGAPLWRQDPLLSFLGAAFCGGDCGLGLIGGESCARQPDGAVSAEHPKEEGGDPHPCRGVGCGACLRRALCPQLLDGLWEAGLGSCWKSFLPPWLAPGARDTGGPSRSCHLCPWSTCLGRTAWFGSQLGVHTCKQGSRWLQGI